MITSITISRADAKGRYANILDVLESMRDECGSAVNAAAVCIRDSQKFKEAAAKYVPEDDAGVTK